MASMLEGSGGRTWLWGHVFLGCGSSCILCPDQCGVPLSALDLQITALILAAVRLCKGVRDKVMGLEECPDT